MLFDDHHDNTSSLLHDQRPPWQGLFLSYASLPMLMVLSGSGMLTLKAGERSDNTSIVVLGLLLEGAAFLIYPYSMRTYQLRTITTCWSGGCIITALTGGHIFFDEVPSHGSLAGCSLIVAGIIMTSVS